MDILCCLGIKNYTTLGKTWKICKSSKRQAVDLAHEVFGSNPSQDGKTVLALHGLLGSRRNWRNPCRKIAAATKAAVIAADLRNHGDSPHDNTHTYFDLASDVARLMDKFSIATAHLIGHSMGGKTAMVLALTEPSKVKSLIIADISPVPRQGVLNEFFPKLVEVMISVNFQGADNIIKARTVATDTIVASGLMQKEGLGFIIMNIGQLPDKTYGWKCNLLALRNNFVNISSFPSELSGKQYPGPALFIGGGQSDFLPKSEFEQIKQLFPQATLTYIDHVGHNVHVEDPVAFTNLVNEFLGKVL